jgi:hypothetical protein
MVVSFMVAVPFSLVDHCSARPDPRTELIGHGTQSDSLVTHVADEVLRDESHDGGKARLRTLHTSALLVGETGRAATGPALRKGKT